ncbi:MAG: RNA polymerase subunit sigma-70 [Ruminococcus sp.]|nr:RNA polymerase subunit sigma-70 [Ruminococcus sp.]
MNAEQKCRITELRQSGLGYKAISEQLDISINTVKSYCQRHHLQRQTKSIKENILFCLHCGKEVPQTPHRKAKKFCCDKCRMAWWTEHSAIIHKKSQQEYICPICGNPFLAYKSKMRKYCSRICYGKSKGVQNENRDIQ